MKNITCILVLLFLGLSIQTSKAQTWEVGGYIGGASYQGDLVVPALFTLKETNFALGLIGRRYINESWAVRGNLIFSGLSGDDYNFDERKDPSSSSHIPADQALKFTSPLIEFTVYGEWYPFGKRIENYKINHNVDYFQRVQPYGFLGIGGVYTNPDVTTNSGDPLPASVTYDDTKVHISIPIGAGVKWDLNPNWVLSVEGGFRYPITDVLEGISEGRDPDDNDWYAVAGIGLSYRFDYGKKYEDEMNKLETGKTEIEETIDTDGDGLLDAIDGCPLIAGPKENNGCPEVTVEDKELLNFAMANVQFETASATLTNSSLSVLDQVYGVLEKYPYYKLQIHGHTDNVGDAASNLTLSKNRALSCYDYLRSKGISSTRLSHNGFGETQPIADNETEQGRKSNRRVAFTLHTL